MKPNILLRQELSQVATQMDALIAAGLATPESRSEFEALEAKAKEMRTRLDMMERGIALGQQLSATGAPPNGDPRQPAQVHDNAEDAPWQSAGHFLRAVQAAANRVIDPRLRRHDVTSPEVRSAAGLNESTASEGGFLVGTDFSNTLMEGAVQDSEIWSRASDIPVSGPSNGMRFPTVDETSRADGARSGGVQAFWQNEAETLQASKPKLGAMEMNLQKLIGLVYMTDELLQDAPALQAFTEQEFRNEFSFKLDDAAIRGSGAGMPLGILNSPALVTIAKEAGQANGTIVSANVTKMWAQLLSRAKAESIWLTNSECFSQLIKMFIPFTNVAGTENVGGAPVYLPPGGIAGQQYGTLLGRPVIEVEQASALGAVGDLMLIDPTRYRTISKGGIKSDVSIHVKFLTDEVAFRYVVRVNGMPMEKSSITPYKGATAKSSFVTLAAR